MGFRAAPVVCLALWCAPAAVFAQTTLEAEFADEYDRPAPAAPPAAPEPDPAPAPIAVVVSTEAEVGADAPPGPHSRRAVEREDELFRAHNTWPGPVGGIHVVDAGSGPVGSLRLQIGLDVFEDTDYLAVGDSNSFVGGTLSIGATVAEYLELFGSIANHANFNDAGDPELLQVLGDTLLGVKAFHTALPWLTVGGDLRLVFLNSVGDIGVAFDGTSVGLRGNLAMDLRELRKAVPLQIRFNLDYLFDNSARLIEDVEGARYQALPADRREVENEDRHLITRVERFGLGINRTDLFTLGVGLEAPLRVDGEFFVHPIAEFRLGVPVNRQDYNCLVVPGNADVASADGCLDLEGVAAMPSTLTLAIRVLPPVRGLSLALGVDVGLTGVTTFVRETRPNRPHAVLLALSYAVDTAGGGAVREVEVVREVEAPAEPPGPRIDGTVVEAGTDTAVAGAVVRYLGTDLTPQATDDAGRFVSYELAPGTVRMHVTHPLYEGRDCTAELPAPPAPPAADAAETTADAEAADEAAAGAAHTKVRCELTARPRFGRIRGQVLDPEGKPVDGASVELTGPLTKTLVSGAGGRFDLDDALPGDYQARIDHPDYLLRMVSFTLRPEGTASPQAVLVPKPKKSQVTLTREEVRIKKRIFFKSSSAEIDDKSHELLSEIADVLLRNPHVTSVEVQGHTDNRGGSDLNQTLSQQRAESVMRWLVNAGVAQSRLGAKGYGDTRPLVPNLTAGNRARNRRVQFIILEQQTDPAPTP